jgi:hypothetical protein
VAAVTASTAVSKAARLAAEGSRIPPTFRTYWSEASRISISLAGGSKLKSGRIDRHTVATFTTGVRTARSLAAIKDGPPA